MRLARRMLTLGGTEPAPERHYLAFDGVADRAYAQGVRLGTGTEYAVVVKLGATNPNVNFGGIAILSDPARTTAYRNCTDNLQSLSTSQRHRHTGLRADGTNNYGRDQSSGDGATGRHVQMAGRFLSTDLARARVFTADGTTIWAPTDVSATEDTQPLDLILGAFLDYRFANPTLYTPIAWIASVVLPAVPTDAQLQAYAASTCHDAREVWGSDIRYYVTASGLLGGSTGPIAPVVGTSPLVLVGPAAADLVAL